METIEEDCYDYHLRSITMQDYCFSIEVLAVIGITAVSAISLQLLKGLCELTYNHLISRCCNRNLKDFGQWAVVTGGSSGIGKAYAIELAKRGMDIVIISNELEALMTTESEIKKLNQVQCCYIHADFTEGEHRKVAEQLQDKDIGILINCAGILGNMLCRFLEETESNMFKMIDIHVKTVVQLTRAILPSMLVKKKGIIVNVSSMASLIPFPNYSVYSACKAFSDRFSKAISCEYNNLHIQSLTPYFVLTRMIERFVDTIPFKGCVLSSKQLAKNAIPTLTFTNYTTGFWINDICRWSSENLIPKIVWVSIFYKILDKQKDSNCPVKVENL